MDIESKTQKFQHKKSLHKNLRKLALLGTKNCGATVGHLNVAPWIWAQLGTAPRRPSEHIQTSRLHLVTPENCCFSGKNPTKLKFFTSFPTYFYTKSEARDDRDAFCLSSMVTPRFFSSCDFSTVNKLEYFCCSSRLKAKQNKNNGNTSHAATHLPGACSKKCENVYTQTIALVQHMLRSLGLIMDQILQRLSSIHLESYQRGHSHCPSVPWTRSANL